MFSDEDRHLLESQLGGPSGWNCVPESILCVALPVWLKSSGQAIYDSGNILQFGPPDGDYRFAPSHYIRTNVFRGDDT